MTTATLSQRNLYCPAHFGNSYEVALDHEMTDYLNEARYWGFNRYSDWFDTIDLHDVYDPDRKHHDFPEALWARKLSSYSIAQKLGYQLGLVVTPNHVFANQVTPENAATPGDRYFGQLVCPSKAGVTEMILNNYRQLFQSFKERDLGLTFISGGAYDYGGCACDQCNPWITAFAKLFHAICELADSFFPNIERQVWAWWWTPEDHQQFSEWTDRHAPRSIQAAAIYLPYGESRYQPNALPAGCAEQAFVHIGYGNNKGGDVYGHYGPAVAPTRLPATIDYLHERDATGFLAYSEGAFDECNKAILGGLTSGQFATAHDVLAAYADRYLDGDTLGWAHWLASMSDFASIDVVRARKQFDRLCPGSRPSWRLEQWALRLQLAEADRHVQCALADDRRNDAAQSAARFYEIKESLYRRTYRLGLPRHIFRFDLYLPQWATQLQAANVNTITKVALPSEA